MTRDKTKFILIGVILLLLFLWSKKDDTFRSSAQVQPPNHSILTLLKTDAESEPIIVSTDEKINIDVFEKVHPAVVNIATTTLGMNFWMEVIPRQGQGSGFIIDSRGYIMTNNHVVANAQEIIVTMSKGKKDPGDPCWQGSQV